MIARGDRASTARRASATIDFTGTSAQQPTNFNAPSAVCKAAVLYVFRTLVDDEIPMNAGCLKPLRIVIPEGSMLDAALSRRGRRRQRRDVAGGHRRALRRARRAGGVAGHDEQLHVRQRRATSTTRRSPAAPAPGPDFDGASAVQTHMTNSRLTDPEVLEWRFPVRLESFAIRRGSGGAGAHRGGDGATRRVRFLEPMTAVMLANHRRIAPFGMAGGAPGALGRNWVERARRHARGRSARRARSRWAPATCSSIETPGGGGFGPADPAA